MTWPDVFKYIIIYVFDYLLSWSTEMFVCRVLSNNKIASFYFVLTSGFRFYLCIPFGLQTMSFSGKRFLKSESQTFSHSMTLNIWNYNYVQKHTVTYKNFCLLTCIQPTLNIFSINILLHLEFFNMQVNIIGVF